MTHKKSRRRKQFKMSPSIDIVNHSSRELELMVTGVIRQGDVKSKWNDISIGGIIKMKSSNSSKAEELVIASRQRFNVKSTKSYPADIYDYFIVEIYGGFNKAILRKEILHKNEIWTITDDSFDASVPWTNDNNIDGAGTRERQSDTMPEAQVAAENEANRICRLISIHMPAIALISLFAAIAVIFFFMGA